MNPSLPFQHIAVLGGAGYVGSALVPRLLQRGHTVTVIDLFWYGDYLPKGDARGGTLRRVPADIRDFDQVARALQGVDAVIHLACISNDPCFELNPQLGKSINLDAFPHLLTACRQNHVKRFIYASSSSVYGVREEPQVTETTPCTPLTDYSRFKLECERILFSTSSNGMERVVIRPATVCGYAPRMRFDLTVNILTISALERGEIFVDGGEQLRPNIHISDMVRAYETLLDAPDHLVRDQVFNAGYQNASINKIAEIVHSRITHRPVKITRRPTNDLRSYRIDSVKICERLGFSAQKTIEEAVDSIIEAHAQGRLPEPLSDARYYNVKVMKEKHLA